MMRYIARRLPTSVVALVLAAGPALAAGDVEAGRIVFMKCALCHTIEAGKNKLGPSLFGVVGRSSASVPDFNYSEGMKNFKHEWTPQELDAYLTDPHQVIPTTKMFFVGLKDEKDRQDVIAYLQTLK